MALPEIRDFRQDQHSATADEIRAQVDRIATSQQFGRSARLVSMLRYVVEHTLAHPDRPLKEYRLGVEVFGRDPDYDTRLDPVVRVEMRRLRQRLASYYDNGGRGDTLRIDVPRGGYAATFEWRPSGPAGEQREDMATATAPVEPEGSAAGQRPSRVLRGSRATYLAIAAALALVVLVGLSSLRYPPASRPPERGPGPTRVLVTQTGLAARDVRMDARLLDELVGALSRVEGLRVLVAARPPLGLGGPPADGELALRTDQEENGGRRVSIRLTETASGAVIWTRAFALPARPDEAAIAAIAATVAGAIRLRLDPESGQPFIRRGNDDEEAGTLYRHARTLATTRGADALSRSLSLYEQAVARDPGFALAFAGIADVLAVQLANGVVEPGVGLAAAQAAAARAHALDPSLGEALAHLAYFEGFANWRWERSLAEFRRALAITPHHAPTHAWHGQTLLAMARFDEAIDALLQAQRLDPTTPSITQALGEAYYYAGRYDDVVVQARRLLEADPQRWGGHYLLARTAIARADREAALDALVRSRGELWSEVSRLVVLGDCAAARGRLEREGEELGQRQPFTVASLYALAGDPERALAWLTRAVDQRQLDVASLAIDPPLQVLRGRPEFQALIARVGLGAHAASRPRPPAEAATVCP